MAAFLEHTFITISNTPFSPLTSLFSAQMFKGCITAVRDTILINPDIAPVKIARIPEIEINGNTGLVLSGKIGIEVYSIIGTIAYEVVRRKTVSVGNIFDKWLGSSDIRFVSWRDYYSDGNVTIRVNMKKDLVPEEEIFLSLISSSFVEVRESSWTVALSFTGVDVCSEDITERPYVRGVNGYIDCFDDFQEECLKHHLWNISM